MVNLDVKRFLTDLTGRYAKPYIDSLEDMLVAIAMQNKPAARSARLRFEKITAETMGIGELLGAALALRKSATIYQKATFGKDKSNLIVFSATDSQKVLPRVTFQEALDDIVTRTPVTIRSAAERTAQRISELYSRGHMIAFAFSAEAAVTKEVQRVIAGAIRDGLSEVDAGRRIMESANITRKRSRLWTESYGRLVFRNNLNTAVTAGRFRQALDPQIQKVIPAMRFDAIGDVDTRDNHNAANGFIAKVSNTIWSKIATPLGHNCRCELGFVTIEQLRRMGRVRDNGSIVEDKLPSGAFPDPGFKHGGRPDLFMNQVAG